MVSRGARRPPCEGGAEEDERGPEAKQLRGGQVDRGHAPKGGLGARGGSTPGALAPIVEAWGSGRRLAPKLRGPDRRGFRRGPPLLGWGRRGEPVGRPRPPVPS